MSGAFGTQAFQQSRHARRIYVGGFPPNYGDEEALKFFLNSVIAKGLGEPNDNSYVLSIYVNQKKCFAFVELRSIELATACLELDGIVYKKVALKVLRANEYKPELIPPSMVGLPITLDLSSFTFGNSASVAANTSEKSNASLGITGIASSSTDLGSDDARLDSVIQFASLSYVSTGAISIIGYPFDDRIAHSFTPVNKDGTPGSAGGNNPSNQAGTGVTASSGAGSGGYTGLGCTQAAKKMRNIIRKYKFGMVHNPEYGVDLSQLKFVDIGDVQVGKTREETKYNLTAIVSDVVQKRSVPFVVGGGSDCSYYNALGVISAVEARIGMVVVSAQIDDTRLLDDQRFVSYTVAGGTSAAAHSGSGSFTSMRSDGEHAHAQQMASEMDAEGAQQAAGVRSPQHSVADCGGRYVRFAAQGSQCTAAQANNVTNKGGHIVWLGRDIRNQSPLCSVLPADYAQQLQQERTAGLVPSNVPHAHTLRLFREALRCAAGVTAVVSAPPSTNVSAVSAISEPPLLASKSAESPIATALREASRMDSQDAITLSPLTPAAVLPSSLVREGSDNTGNTSNETVSHATTTGPPPGIDVTASPRPAPASPPASAKRPHGVVVSFDMGCMHGATRGCGYVTGSSSSATGLTVDEVLDMAMLAGADPNVLSLDISEFSPDAEDTRPNMLLAQLFYHFSLGVASRPDTKGTRRGSGAGLEVEAKVGSFRLQDHAGYLPPRIQTDKDVGLTSSSRTPKYYQEVSSGSMDVLSGSGGAYLGSATTVVAESSMAGTARPPNMAASIAAQHPYVEVDHRYSSMDAMELSVSALAGADAHYRPLSVGSTASGRQSQSPVYPASPSSQHGSNVNFSGSGSSTDMRTLYPAGVLNPRHAVQQAQEGGMLGVNRPLPGVPMRPPSHPGGGSSPPTHMRSITAPKLPPAAPTAQMSGPSGASAYYQAGGQQQRSAPSPGNQQALSVQQQHQQMFAQQALMLQQQQQAYVHRNQPYRPSAYPPSQGSYPSNPPPQGSYPSNPQAQQSMQGQGYPPQQRRYEPDLQQLDPDFAQQYGRAGVSPSPAGLYDRPDSGRYQQQSQGQGQGPMQQMHRTQQPTPPSPYRYGQPSPHHAHEEQSQSSSYLGADFLDITGERSTGSGLSRGSDPSGGGFRMPSASPVSELGQSGGLAGLGVGSTKSVGGGLTGSSLDVHSFDENLDLFDYRQPQTQQGQSQRLGMPNQARPPSAGPSMAQRSAPGGAYGMYPSAANSMYSTDSLAYSNANSSLNSELMAGLGGLGSTHSLGGGGYGTSIFGPPQSSPQISHGQGSSSPGAGVSPTSHSQN